MSRESPKWKLRYRRDWVGSTGRCLNWQASLPCWCCSHCCWGQGVSKFPWVISREKAISLGVKPISCPCFSFRGSSQQVGVWLRHGMRHSSPQSTEVQSEFGNERWDPSGPKLAQWGRSHWSRFQLLVCGMRRDRAALCCVSGCSPGCRMCPDAHGDGMRMEGLQSPFLCSGRWALVSRTSWTGELTQSVSSTVPHWGNGDLKGFTYSFNQNPSKQGVFLPLSVFTQWSGSFPTSMFLCSNTASPDLYFFLSCKMWVSYIRSSYISIHLSCNNMVICIKTAFTLVGLSKATSNFEIMEISSPGENKSVSSTQHPFLLLYNRKTAVNKDTHLLNVTAWQQK